MHGGLLARARLPLSRAPHAWASTPPLPPNARRRLPYEDLNTFQIIAKVQAQGAAALRVPPPSALPAGAFACYDQFVQLMGSCWATDPDARPTFGHIVQQLG